MKFLADGTPSGFDDFEHIPGYIDSKDSDEYFERLTNELNWTEVKWGTGKTLPRLIYSYDMNHGNQPILNELIEYMSAILETTIIGVWCNLYRDGNDWTPHHQDSYGAHVVTLTFGSTRKFSLKEIGGEKKRIDFNLGHGDLFYFNQSVNSKHTHTIPKTAKQVGPRISVVLFTSKPYSDHA